MYLEKLRNEETLIPFDLPFCLSPFVWTEKKREKGDLDKIRQDKKRLMERETKTDREIEKR
jgi:hypothetical protein